MLTDFPGKTQHFNIAERIGRKFLSVGISLLNDERGEVVPAIALEHRGNAEQINMDILSRWVRGKGIADCTWQGLLGVLRIHCPGLAQDMEETLRTETADSSLGLSGTSDTDGSTAVPPQQQSTLSLFNKKLRDWYAENPLPYYFNPHCYKWMSNVIKAYIHPDIISKEEQEEQPDSHKEAVLRGHLHQWGRQWGITEKGNATPVQLETMLEAGSGDKCKCVLVEGGPGMGKSTLVWQVCHRWGRRELFNQYSTVLLLPLRDKRVQQAKQVKDLFFHFRDKKAQEEVKQDIGKGKKTLVILDGLDELPSNLLLEQSIFTNLLSGEVLGDATILVTSRPSATQQLLMYWKQRISKHFIIRGFNEGDIEEYTKTILSGEKLTDFQKHLSSHPYIQSIMYVPLHSAFVMAVYLQHKWLPKTQTQLYMALTETILSQYLDDHPEYCEKEDVSCAIGLQLPKTVNARFLELCQIAFDTVCKQELIFTDKTMPKILHDLGFTDSVPGLYMHRTCSYNFLHLSIQEFLAAYHVSLQSPQEQELLLLKSRKEHHFMNMMRYIAGFTNFEGIRKVAVKQVIVVEEETKHKCYLDGYSLELLHECQNIRSILDKKDTYSVDSWLPSHHCLALGYCIANSKCAWKLDLSRVYMHIPMLVQGLSDCKTDPAYIMKHITWNEYTNEEAVELLTQSPAYFTTHIKSIHIKSLRLETFNVSDDDNDSDYDREDLEASHEFDLSRILTVIPSLKKLKLEKLTHQSMQALTSWFQQNQSLTNLDISWCKIDSRSICCLARALHSNTTLMVLNMFTNLLGGRGALAIAEMLKYNTTLTVLDVSRNSVGKRGALAMAEVLKYNTTLTELHISRNSVGERGALAMAEMLYHNTTLTKLDISRNSVGERGALVMAEMLKHNTTLTALEMSRNSVGERGALAMAEMLKHNATLEELHMYEVRTGEIGVEGAKALVESLAVNRHLKTLYISDKYKVEEVKALPSYQSNKKRVFFLFILRV